MDEADEVNIQGLSVSWTRTREKLMRVSLEVHFYIKVLQDEILLIRIVNIESPSYRIQDDIITKMGQEIQRSHAKSIEANFILDLNVSRVVHTNIVTVCGFNFVSDGKQKQEAFREN